MDQELFSIINDIVDNSDLDCDDLCDNTIFEETKVLVLEIYSQFMELSCSDDVNKICDEIHKLLYQKQNMPQDPNYSQSELLYLEFKFKHLEQIPQPEQRSPEWHIFRNNRLTASDFYSVMDKGAIAKRNELIMKKCGADMPFLTNDAILHGVKFEELAVKIYEKRNKLIISEFGCLPHPIIPFFGASPDGIVHYNSENKNYVGRMLEIKCPKSRKITGIIPPGYFAQVQGQLEVCDLEYCDFLECDFQKYTSKDAFFEDTEPFKEKGIIVEFYDYKLKKNLYYYSEEKHVKCIETFESWVEGLINKIYDNDQLEYLTSTFWYLNKYNVVLVKRDRNYFTTNFANIKSFWDDVLKHREIGIESLKNTKPKKAYKEKELNFLD
jgi:putative phage-type endonuclease